MARLPKYECDGEFLKLMMRRSDVNLTVAALELARDADPDLDFQPTLTWMDDRAAELAGEIARATSEDAALRALSRCLADRHGLHGCDRAFCCADGSYLHCVVETGRGIPISLSAIYIAVAQRVGIDLAGAAAPAHFLCRCETPGGPLFVDPYHGGRLMTECEVVPWISELSECATWDVRRSLGRATPRTIIMRMLNNLKVIHAQHQNWHQAWLAQHRLTALQPSVYRERRDLALLSVRANRAGTAIDLLESCLKTCPQEDREILEESLAQANTQLVRWN